MKHNIATYRNAGLNARWGKTSAGTPVIFVRNPIGNGHQKNTWWMVTNDMFECMKVNGIMEGFDNCTLLGDIFSIKV